MKRKVAVVLLNLGGPSSLDNVEEFLFSMFSDRHIIDVPAAFRFLIAKVLSKLRTKAAVEIYKLMGGRSIVLYETEKQASALESSLNREGNNHYKVFVCMRHSDPRAANVLKLLCDYNADKVVLLPMYPQYSCVTTQSAIEDWFHNSHKTGITFDTHIVWNYNQNAKYIDAMSELIMSVYREAARVHPAPRILFSAHGLPLSFIERGDPYMQLLQQTVRLIVSNLGIEKLDYVLCFQSKVGPLKWLEPYTTSELLRANSDNVPVVVVPVAFVSENSETCVELDIEYKALFDERRFFRVPALGTDSIFIECLKDIVLGNCQ
ncbi:ferrochelatase [Candidatus Anaplasma sp. TIGMIC]|uniref:ferrochelatase n=1 Tax=Candidatus Anaplasma sp. TIGMIC TaxID=3020713 RepID=UPI00232BE377|nr:ferrochelatase [Candidatus Anaplasma sp. TIGMIC]MDB1135205.1 ferrochelatase [Candidatus Anaplasma sp. TIGMIC]